MRKLSLLCVVLLAVGCSTQVTEPVKELYVGTTPIKFPAPKGMEEVTPKMGLIYDVIKDIARADLSNYYISQYLNLNNIFETGRSCAVFMPRKALYASIPDEVFQEVKFGYKTQIKEIMSSKSVQDNLRKNNNAANQIVGISDEHIGTEIVKSEMLKEDVNTIVQYIEYENVAKSNGKIQKEKEITVMAFSYVKEKLIALKCQGNVEDKAYFSSLLLDWNDAFIKVNQ